MRAKTVLGATARQPREISLTRCKSDLKSMRAVKFLVKLIATTGASLGATKWLHTGVEHWRAAAAHPLLDY